MKIRNLILAFAVTAITAGAAHADTIQGSSTFSSNIGGVSNTYNTSGGSFDLTNVTVGVPVTITNYLDIFSNGNGTANLTVDFTITDPGTGTGNVGGKDVFALQGQSNTTQGSITWTNLSSLQLSNGQFLSISLSPVKNSNLSNGAYVDATFTLTGTPTSLSAVPEPSTLALLGSGLLGIAFVGRRKLRGGMQQPATLA